MLREPGREWLSRAGTMAQCGYQILQGIPRGSAGMCLGSWQCAGSACTLCFVCLLHSLGLSCWGHRNRLELWVRCHGCYHSLGRSHRWWEGHRGFGSHWAGTGELEERLMQLAVSLSSVWPSPAGTPGGHQAPRLGLWLLQAARCLWKPLTVAPVPGG